MKRSTTYVFVVPEAAVTVERDRVFWGQAAEASMRSALQPGERAVGDVVFDLWEVPEAGGGPRALRWTWTIEVTDGTGLGIDQVEFSREGLTRTGFQGFRTFAELRGGALEDVPRTGGVYVVIRESPEPVEFLTASPGGHFKGKDPTADPAILSARWIDDAKVIYIGKGDVLRRRLKEFSAFGVGQPVGHWGGRYVWQVSGSEGFVVAWLETPSEDPRSVESRLLARFREVFGGPPFANIV